MTPEQQTEAALAMAIERVPMWTDQIWTLLATARDAAPQGEEDAWVDAVRASCIKDYSHLCERIVATVDATPDQAQRFAQAVAAAMAARFAELTIGCFTQGGHA